MREAVSEHPDCVRPLRAARPLGETPGLRAPSGGTGKQETEEAVRSEGEMPQRGMTYASGPPAPSRLVSSITNPRSSEQSCGQVNARESRRLPSELKVVPRACRTGLERPKASLRIRLPSPRDRPSPNSRCSLSTTTILPAGEPAFVQPSQRRPPRRLSHNMQGGNFPQMGYPASPEYQTVPGLPVQPSAPACQMVSSPVYPL